MLLALFGCVATVEPGSARGPGSAALVVQIVVDQYALSLHDTMQSRYTGGLARLASGWSGVGRYPYACTWTGPGHATLATGRLPSEHGIAANRWYEHGNDDVVDVRGAEQLSVPTVADRVIANGGKVVSLSVKERGARLLAGRSPTLAVWLDGGEVKTSGSAAIEIAPPPAEGTWDRFPGAERPNNVEISRWELPDAGATAFPHARKGSREMAASPFPGTWLVETAALTVERLELGADGSPDLLTISFSEVDYVGHRYTPESWEAQDNLLWLDRDLGTLFTRLDALGIAWAAVLTADHGVLPTPAALLSGWDVAEHIDGALAAAGIAGSATWLNPGIWLAGVPDSRRSDALSIALATARDIDGVGIAVPGAGPIDPSTPFREQIAACRAPGRTAEVLLWPRWGVAWLDEAHVPRGARPTAPPEPMATDHGTPYAYDREVPILAFGAGVTATATTADRTETFYDMRRVAPTVACLVGVVPAGGLDALPVAKTLRCPR